MRVVTILVRHGTDKYADAEARIAEIFSRQMPGVDRTSVIVDNALPEGFVDNLNATSTVIGSNNSSWEFSAWDSGIDFLGDKIWSYDLVHFATSAFHTLYVKYLDRFEPALLRAIAGRPVCLGHIDCYNQAIRILSYQSQHWVRTSFLFVPPTEIKTLRSLVSMPSTLRMFGDGPKEPFSSDAPLSQNYQTYILDWLTGGDIGQGSVWHSRIGIDERSRALFEAKASAIFNEHLLAIRLRAQGTRVIDTTWLATQLKTRDANEIDWSTSWRTQLASRDTDKLVIPL